MIGASAALTISEIPFLGPLGAVRVGLIDGEFVVNPTRGGSQGAKLDLVVSGSKDAIVMVEAGAHEVTEEECSRPCASRTRRSRSSSTCSSTLQQQVGKPKWEVTPQ